MHIGIDFDNTIVSYDSLFFRSAIELGLTGPGVQPVKNAVREYIRSLENGEQQWQKLQAVVYCYRMKDAELMDGVSDFFRCCREQGIRLSIVSHKTEYAAQDKNANLRRASLDWMRAQGFFSSPELGFTEGDIFFESTRTEKIERIADLGCTHFIDDLIEVLSDPCFPADIRKILLSANTQQLRNGIVRIASWYEIKDYLFNKTEE